MGISEISFVPDKKRRIVLNKMEKRNYYNTPRDMISDEMLTELLREKEPQSSYNYGYYGTNRAARAQRPTPRNEMGGNNNVTVPENMGSCGCKSKCGYTDSRDVRNYGTPNCRGEYQAVPVGNVEHPHKWENPRLEGTPLAMVYSPAQEFEGLYDVEKALSRGTLFEKLDLVFYSGCCSR